MEKRFRTPNTKEVPHGPAADQILAEDPAVEAMQLKPVPYQGPSLDRFREPAVLLRERIRREHP